MTDFSFLADDGLVDALIMEVAGLLSRFVDHGEHGAVDLLGLPLSPSCLATLEQRLGKGEIAATLDAAGRSDVQETAYPGVWWTRHFDESNRLVAMLIEVAPAPEILLADVADIVDGLARLSAATCFAARPRGKAA